MSRERFTNWNHYNPCVWTALWNVAHFETIAARAEPAEPARKQVVSVLNVRSAKIYESTVERVHRDRGLGVAEITPESMKSFCLRWYPDKFDELAAYVEKNPETLFMDFEDILQGVEQAVRYDGLLEAARIGGFSSNEHRGFVMCLLIIHAMRSHEMMHAMVAHTASIGMPKWEYFWLLKNAWSSQALLARATFALAISRWVLYRTNTHTFPLCDSPVMIGRRTLMAILSPRLLLEVDLAVRETGNTVEVRDRISSSKLREFRRRAIQSSFKEILFSDREELERWRSLPEFRARVACLSDSGKHEAAIHSAAARVHWAMLGFGIVPADFEKHLPELLRG